MSKLIIRKTDYPFVVTTQGRQLIKNAEVNLDYVEKKSPNETKRFAFLMCKAACQAKKQEFPFTWEVFIQLVEPEVIEKSVKLLTSMKNTDKKALKKAKAEKAARLEAEKKAKEAAEKKAKEEAEKKAKEEAERKTKGDNKSNKDSEKDKAGEDNAKGSNDTTGAGSATETDDSQDNK